MKIKLAEALLRRKELQEKVDRLRTINQEGLFEVKARRQAVADGIDDLVASVPKIAMQQVTAAFDYYAKQLRLIDAQIQQANWQTDITVGDKAMDDFIDPYVVVK